MLPAAAGPIKVGVVSLVMLSVADPLSEELVRSGVTGGATIDARIVTESAADDGPTLPAGSVAVAVILYVAAARVDEVMVQPPLEFAVAVPIRVEPA